MGLSARSDRRAGAVSLPKSHARKSCVCSVKKYSHCEEAHGASALLMFRRIYRHHPVDGATLSE
jgi:hypothetical protein